MLFVRRTCTLIIRYSDPSRTPVIVSDVHVSHNVLKDFSLSQIDVSEVSALFTFRQTIHLKINLGKEK